MSAGQLLRDAGISRVSAIDDALGIGDDGCGDHEQTLAAIADLQTERSA